MRYKGKRYVVKMADVRWTSHRRDIGPVPCTIQCRLSYSTKGSDYNIPEPPSRGCRLSRLVEQSLAACSTLDGWTISDHALRLAQPATTENRRYVSLLRQSQIAACPGFMLDIIQLTSSECCCLKRRASRFSWCPAARPDLASDAWSPDVLADTSRWPTILREARFRGVRPTRG